jgi:hypothetical protein
MSFGGFLGVGGKPVAVSIHQNISCAAAALPLDLTRA